MFATWGEIVHRQRWAVVVLSLLSLAVAGALIVRGGRFDPSIGSLETESAAALRLMEQALPARPVTFHLILSSPTHAATDPAFAAEVQRALVPLRGDPRVAAIRTAYDGGAPDPLYLSRDGRHTLAVVELTLRSAEVTSVGFASVAADVYAALRARVRSDVLQILPAGDVALNRDFQEISHRDLWRCELAILSILPALLVAVFGSVVAASLPLGVGLLAVAAGLAGTLALSEFTSVSIYAGNLVSMIGMGVAVDYALFVTSRFREEIQSYPVPEALARTMATAGLAVLFSGLTVATGLLGIVVLGLGNLGSMGLGGILVVAMAVLYSLTLLPALLAILGPRVNALRIPFLNRRRPEAGRALWERLSGLVMARPWTVLVCVAAVLLLLGSPVLRLRLGMADVRTLPPHAESRRGEELLRAEFPAESTTPIVVVLEYADGSPLTPERVGQMYDLSRWLAGLAGITRVDSLVDLAPGLGREQYQQLAALAPDQRPPGLDAVLGQMVGGRIATLVAHTAHPAGSDEARALVQAIRAAHPRMDATLSVTGRTAFDLDLKDLVVRHSPRAVLLIVVATYAVLFFLLGSLLLPLKALVMNVLSISASYGALVWIFQDGHLAGWLGFTPGPIETTTPLIMFCTLFGLSMDYEVFLLSRIREEYQRTGDNARAVTASLAKTGRIITGAAAIMAAVFFTFGAADVVVVKAIGIGMGLAVVMDATIVRALLVPATMRLLGDWNWWAPGPLARLHVRLGLAADRLRGAGGPRLS